LYVALASHYVASFSTNGDKTPKECLQETEVHS